MRGCPLAKPTKICQNPRPNTLCVAIDPTASPGNATGSFTTSGQATSTPVTSESSKVPSHTTRASAAVLFPQLLLATKVILYLCACVLACASVHQMQTLTVLCAVALLFGVQGTDTDGSNSGMCTLVFTVHGHSRTISITLGFLM